MTARFFCYFGLFLIFGFSAVVAANDSEIEIAAGGIKFVKNENIELQRETLDISLDEVIVDYTFFNVSSSSIVTTVAFPIPAFSYLSPAEHQLNKRFNEFSVFVDGRQIDYFTYRRAIANGKDVTEILTTLGVDVEEFGGFDFFADIDEDLPSFYVIPKLGKDKISKLKAVGAVEDIDGKLFPAWQVEKMYYWNGEFRKGGKTTVRHKYVPRTGGRQVSVSELEEGIPEMCLDKDTGKQIAASILSTNQGKDREGLTLGVSWVKYILTTAQNWKMPIQEFVLRIHKPVDHKTTVTMCWDGFFNKQGDFTLESRLRNFVPKNDLTVFFVHQF